MGQFWTTLVGACVGVFAVSVFMPTARLRRPARESLAIAAAAVFGAGVTAWLAGKGASGLATGVAFALAFVLVPRAILAFRLPKPAPRD